MRSNQTMMTVEKNCVFLHEKGDEAYQKEIADNIFFPMHLSILSVERFVEVEAINEWL